MRERKFLGIIVSPANVQTEGMTQVFNNLDYLKADAIAIDPWLLKPAAAGEGSRIPDLHIDGHARRFSRPLWGETVLNVEAFLAFQPQESLYADGPYRPAGPVAPNELNSSLPQEMIEEAAKRNLKVQMGFAPFLPAGVLEQDRPRIVDGSLPKPPWIAKNVCLNNPAGQQYALAFMEDLVRNFPGLDGLILDWAEFGAYTLEDHFSCFCVHCQRTAEIRGFNWKEIRSDILGLWNDLKNLTPQMLVQTHVSVSQLAQSLELSQKYSGILDFWRFKADSVVSFFKMAREHLNAIGAQHISLTARGWCPPWNMSSGLDYEQLTGTCAAIAPKLFTFDHAVIPRWIGQTLLDWNPGLAEEQVLAAVTAWLELPQKPQSRSLEQYRIPAPEEPHPIRFEVYQSRINEMVEQIDGNAKCYPIAHPYLPDDQWSQMVALLRDSQADGMWVNYYSYLSDSRIEILQKLWR
jgi:hypothetical protein